MCSFSSGVCRTIQPAEGSVPALVACPCVDGPLALSPALPPADPEQQWAGVGPEAVYAALDYVGISKNLKDSSELTVPLTCSMGGVAFTAGQVFDYDGTDQTSFECDIGAEVVSHSAGAHPSKHKL